ncbi:MAG: WbuC family cupin fold metalloprotein [Gammaproteobacteria bacterium]
MNLRKVNDEVFIALDPIVKVGRNELAFLKEQALANGRKRARICAHQTNEDALHEMVIAISAASYIHPHKHLGKSESFHIVEGEVDVVVFDDEGGIVDIIELGDPLTGHNFYYRLSESAFHTLLIHTDFLVVHEVTNGPFLREKTVLASFAPPEEQPADAKAYVQQVAARAAEFRRVPRGK